MATRKQHYVTFYSPGTFMSEVSEYPIDGWDAAEACRKAGGVKERHGAKPYGFRFRTYIVADPIDDGAGGKLKVTPKLVEESPMYHLGGTVLSIEDIEGMNDKKNEVLLANMRCNGYPLVVDNRNSWRSIQPFNETDVVVNPADGRIVERGDAPDRKAYRAAKAEERRRYYERMGV